MRQALVEVIARGCWIGPTQLECLCEEEESVAGQGEVEGQGDRGKENVLGGEWRREGKAFRRSNEAKEG